MKILYARTQFYFNLKSGGSVGHTLGVLGGFKENNCKIKIISNEQFLGIDDFNYTIIRPKIKRSLREFLYNFYAKNRFKKEILKFNPDFIYHRYTGYTFFVTKLAKELKIPLVLEFNSFDTWGIKYWGKSKNFLKGFIKKHLLIKIIKRIETYNLKNAFLIVAVSQVLKKDLLKFEIPEEKILVNPNGANPEKFNPEVVKSEKCKKLKQNLGIDNSKVVVGFSGTFGPWHGIPQLTRVIDKILKSELLPRAIFLLIGNGPLKKDMKKQIGQYKNVIFAGEISYSEVQDYLAICDILVSPHCPQVDGKEFFGSPTKLFEYMAMGKGIIASNLGQIGEVLKDGRNAILVKAQDEKEFAKGILKLIEDKHLREQLGQQAREDVIANYTWQKNAQRVIEAYCNLNK